MKSIKQLIKDFRATRNAYRELDEKAPRRFGRIAVDTIRDNFFYQHWRDGNFDISWTPRSKKSNYIYDHHPFYKGTVYSSKNPILDQTGNLKNSVKFRTYGSSTYGVKRVVVGVNLSAIPYAKIMQEGGVTTWLGNTIEIPPRKYIGWSESLRRRIKSDINTQRYKVFKKYKR